MILYRDATGVIVGTQVEAKRMGKGWEQVNVPVDKQGLIDYLNATRLPDPDDVPFEVDQIVVAPEMRQVIREVNFDDDAFEPYAAVKIHLDKLCLAVAELDGTDLGFVALEVAARFKAMSKEPA